MKRKTFLSALFLAGLSGLAWGQEPGTLHPEDFEGPAAVFIKDPGVLVAIDFASSVCGDTVYGEFEKGQLLPFVLNDTSYVSLYNYAGDETFVYDTIRVYTRHPENIIRIGNNGGVFTSMDISQLVGLEWINFEYNDLQAIDVTHCPELKMLYLDANSDIKALDVTCNPKLELLDVEMASLTELDVTKNKGLLHLGIGYTDIAEINLDSNTNLYELMVSGTPMTELNTSIFPNLQYLSVSYSRISKLDLSKNPNLYQLFADGLKGDPVTYIDVTHCPKLQLFFASMNALERVDFSQNPDLQSIYVYSNQLEELDISNNPDIIELICWDNNLTYATLPPREIGYYTALPQNEMPIKGQYEVGEEIDLSDQLMVNDVRTTYAWKTGDTYPYVTLLEGMDYEIENGVTRFLRAQSETVFCEMENSFFGTLSLTTARTKIGSVETRLEDDFGKQVRVYAGDGEIHIEGDAVMQVGVFDVNGKLVYASCALESGVVPVPASGLYIVKLGDGKRMDVRKVFVL